MTAIWTFAKMPGSATIGVLEEHGAGFANSPPMSSCNLYSLQIALQLIEMNGYENDQCPVLFGDNAKKKALHIFDVDVFIVFFLQQ